MNNTDSIKEDFDRLSVFSEQRLWDHNNHYHRFLLKHIPNLGKHCMEIGCGAGGFSRLLSKRFEHVEAIDLSPGMLQTAYIASGEIKNTLKCILPGAVFRRHLYWRYSIIYQKK